MMRAETVISLDQLFDLCDTIINGNALLANFEKMDVEDANYMLTFLSGAVYALNGRSIKLTKDLSLLGMNHMRMEHYINILRTSNNELLNYY